MRLVRKPVLPALCAAFLLLLPSPLFAQSQSWKVYGGMQYSRFHPMAFDEPIEPFVNGPAFDLAVSRGFGKWYGIKADVSRTAMYDSEGDPADHSPVSLLTYTFGPVFYRNNRRSSEFARPGSKLLFGEALLGGYRQVTKYSNLSGRPVTGLALMVGGGMDVPLNRRITIRAFDCDWLAFLTDNAVYTSPVPGPKGNLRLSAGLIFRF